MKIMYLMASMIVLQLIGGERERMGTVFLVGVGVRSYHHVALSTLGISHLVFIFFYVYMAGFEYQGS